MCDQTLSKYVKIDLIHIERKEKQRSIILSEKQKTPTTSHRGWVWGVPQQVLREWNACHTDWEAGEEGGSSAINVKSYSIPIKISPHSVHSDPKSEHLSIISRAIMLRLALKGPGRIHDLAVFLDYSSLPQNGELGPKHLDLNV